MNLGNYSDDILSSSTYRNMSAEEQEYWRPFLLARDGYECHRCHTPIEVLIWLSNLKANQTGEPRKLPVVVIDHIDGDSSNTYGPNGEYGGNLQLLCYACNKLKKPAVIKSAGTGREMTQQQFHKIKNEPAFQNLLTNEIIKHKEVCYKKFMAAAASKHGSQITLERYFETIEFSDLNPNGKFEVFQYNEINKEKTECGYRKCNGDHICFRGEMPEIKTDAQIQMREEMNFNTKKKIPNDLVPRDKGDEVIDKYITHQKLPMLLSTEMELLDNFPNLKKYVDWK